MSDLPSKHGPPLDASIIDRAPTNLDLESRSADERAYIEIIGRLSADLEAACAENDRLKSKKTVEEPRAELMRPFSQTVVRFVSAYCFGVLCLLILAGFPVTTFRLSDGVLMILTGSTGAAVVGLISTIAAGLFLRNTK